MLNQRSALRSLVVRTKMQLKLACVCAATAAMFLSGCGRLGFEAHEIVVDGSVNDADASPDMPRDMLVEASTDLGMDASLDGDMEVDLGADDGVDMGPLLDPGISVVPTSGLITTEMGGIDTFTVVLLAPPTSDVTIALASSDVGEGTVSPASLVFTDINWNAPQVVMVTGVDDLVADGTVDYTITTAAATSTDTRYAGIDADDVAVSNTDDETPGVTVSPTSGLVTSEGGASDTFTVVLNAAPSSDVTIALTSSDVLEVTSSDDILTFTPLNWAAPQTVTITGIDDSDVDADQDFVIVTSATSSADGSYDGLDVDDVTGRNRDDESAGIVVDPTTGLETTESGGTSTFTVVLQSQPTADVALSLTSSNEDEGVVSVSNIVFTSTDWNVPHAITVTGVDDALVDGNQPYTVHVGPAVSADPFYSARTASDVVLTNRDDDAPGYIVTPLTGLLTTEGGGTATFSIVLTSRPSANVIFSVTSSDTTEVVVSTPNPRSTPSAWYDPQIVTLTGVNDSIVDGNQIVDIDIHVQLSADAGYMALSTMHTHVDATNLDDETPGVTVTPSSGLTTSEAGGSATFTIVLDSQPAANVTVSLSSDTLTEGSVSPTSITFTTFNWGIPRTVTVTGANDVVADGARVYHIVTAPAVSADGSYNGINATDVTVTNADNDTAGVTVAPLSIIAPETGTPATFTVALRSQPTASVTIPLHMLDVSQGSLSPASMTFTTGNWNVPQVATAIGINDGVMDGTFLNTAFTDPAVSTDMTYAGLDGPDVTVTHTEMAGISVTPTSGLVTTEAGGTATFTVALVSMPLANVTIQINRVAEGTPAAGAASALILTFTPSNWSTPQTVTVRGLNDSFDDGDVLYTLALQPANSTDLAYAGIDPPDVTLTNIDDDTAGVTVTPVGTAETSEDGTLLMLRLSYAATSSATVRFSFATSDATEGVIAPYAGMSGAFIDTTPTPGLSNIVYVRGVDDLIDDGDIGYTLNITITTTDPGYGGVTIPPIAITNLDNDGASGIIVSPTSNIVATESGATGYAQVVLTHAPTGNVTIAVSSSDLTEATVTPSMLTFTAANWNAPQYVTLTGVADGIVDGNQTVNIVTAPASSTDVSYSGVNAPDASAIVIDVDYGRCASVNTQALPVTGALYFTGNGVLSDDGRYVAFESFASNIVAGDTNNAFDSFLRDRSSATSSRISVTNAGMQASGAYSRVSGDGRFVTFYSDSTGVVAGDTNAIGDIFVRDTVLGTTERVSLSSTGAELNNYSLHGTLSRDGRYVSFETLAAAAPGDVNGTYDVYVRDRTMGTTVRASVNSAGAQGGYYSQNASISGNGRYVTFETSNSFVPSDTGIVTDIYVRDLLLNTTALVSVSMTGTGGDRNSNGAALSYDGRYIAFISAAANLVVGDGFNTQDVFVRDMIAGTTTRVNVMLDGTPGNGSADAPSISSDGQRIAFSSVATNLAPDDTNALRDAFVHDMTTGATTLVSRSIAGSILTSSSFGVNQVSISGDGNYVAFAADFADLVSPTYDTNLSTDIYVVPFP